ncbi:MAG TPA: bifunctional metallophosphatase/5'-nucleotidase [Candidatus Saccharimonadales bacterium]|nr:bifunctional metallophosphatase/5'-nucleotidase [Candidatus Saccharimonadales bacterium]
MTRAPRIRRLVVTLVAASLAMTVLVPSVAAKKVKEPVSVQILGLNDYHGQLEEINPLASSGGRIGFLTDTNPDPLVTNNQCLPETCVAAGGTEYLATHVADLKATNPNTVFVSAGDLIGATPLLSALFHDEPSVEAFNIMGLDYNGVGNHEFDEGIDELLRVAYGSQVTEDYTPVSPDGCHPVDGCGDGDPYAGADFPFLAANVTYKDSGETIFPPYKVHSFPGGVKIAFVGMTLEGTPLIVSPDGIASVDFNDEADSVNALVPHLKRRGVEAIVVLLHEGGSVQGGAGGRLDLIDQCPGPVAPFTPNSPTGDIVNVVERMDDEIDIVITGHTNWAVNCNIDGKVVTGAASQGRLITDIDAKLDRTTKDFVPGSITVDNKVVTRDVPKAEAITDLIAEYNVFAGPIAAERVGATTEAMDRNVRTPGLESTLGRLIADAQLASSQEAGAQIAFMNPGGIRANLDAGDITYGEAFSVQPFSNIVTTKTMTGAQIEMVLEQQFTNNSGPTAGTTLRTQPTVLLVSDGFTYTWDGAGPAGNRVDPSTMALDGVPIDPAGTYRVTMNNFLATGGDDFPAFRLGTDEQTGEDDLIALVDYLGDHDPYTPVNDVRITRVN